MQTKSTKQILFLSGILGLLIFSLSSVSAVSLSSNVVLNTTQSNSSMTFSITVSAQNVTINPNSIYLYFVIYTQNNDTKFCTDLNWSTQNANLDSASFGCTGTAPSTSGGGGGGGNVTIITTFNQTFCGDGICQPLNDLGLQEDFYSCSLDCAPFDLDALVFSFTKNCWDGNPATLCIWGIGNIRIDQPDITTFRNGEVCINEVCERLSGKTLITNCLDDDLNSPCFFDTDTAIISLYLLGILLIATSFVRVKSPISPNKRISPYTYIILVAKRRRKRKGKKWKIKTFRAG